MRGFIRLILVFIFAFLQLLLIQCNKPSEPEFVDLSWKVDTLWFDNEFQIAVRGIWGSSSSDVYVVGHSSSSLGEMWHYDGVKWSIVNLRERIRGVRSYSDVFGFSDKDVWAAGSIGFWIRTYHLIHYDGVNWNYVPIWGSEGGYLSKHGYLTTIDGLYPRLWAGGNNVIFYYDGSSWMRDSIEITGGRGFVVLDIAPVSDTEVYALANREYSDTLGLDFSSYLLRRNDSGIWVVVDSFRCNYRYSERCDNWKWGRLSLWVSPSSGELYLVGPDLTRWNSGHPENIFYHPGLIKVFGTSDNDIWAITYKAIFHFDGENWRFINELPNEFEMGYESVGLIYTDGWTDGSSVFIIAHTDNFPMKGIVFHRRLK